jgi:hypothetical protein
MGREVLIAGAGSAGELDDQTFTHEVGAIYASVRSMATESQRRQLRTKGCKKVSTCCM